MCIKRITQFISLIFLIIPLSGHADFMETVVKIQVRPDATVSFLEISPSKPKVSVILFAGYDGYLKITSEGIRAPSKNFLVRSRQLFTERGFAVAVIDAPSDNESLLDLRSEDWHAQDVKKVMDYMRDKYKTTVWLIGTSRGTVSVVNAAERLQKNGPDGIVLSATVTVRGGQNTASVYDSDLEKITIPTLVVHHRDDDCFVTPVMEAKEMFDDLKFASPKKIIVVSGGNSSSGAKSCGALSQHGFKGIEKTVVDMISDWILNIN